MAQWGFERGFVVEHDPTVKKRISCRDCIYYEETDRSCLRRPLYLPEDGYDSWRRCRYFELSNRTHNYDIKFDNLSKRRKRVSEGKKTNDDTNDRIVVKPTKLGNYVFLLPMNYVFVTKTKQNLKNRLDQHKKQEIRDYYYKNGIFDKPILVRSAGSQYQVVDGFSRYYVAEELELKEVPLMLDTSSGRERYNLCKKGLNVTNDTYGAGTVERYDLLYIVVEFFREDRIAKFNLDMCADKGVIRRP